MAKIKPFKTVRPAPDKVALVTCRTYDDYSSAELAAWLNFNPYSFLHVIHPAHANAQKLRSTNVLKELHTNTKISKQKAF